MGQERTLILLKPDAVKRRLMGEIIQRIESKNFNISSMQLMQVERATAEEHYGEHKDKPFFGELIDFITGGPALAMIVEGPQAISVMRLMMGATNPFEADSGTIRGDFGLDFTANLIHGSDSAESAAAEIARFFG
jgi:nucleoside-diphosphate kinase